MTRLTPYGSEEQIGNVAKIGKSKTPLSLAGRMPSADVFAKVGAVKIKTPLSLAARMPSPEIAAKVGRISSAQPQTRRVVRRSALA